MINIVSIRPAQEKDIPLMVNLSYQKRREYEKAQPLFWRYAAGAERLQERWFQELLQKEDYILLVAETDLLQGFIIGQVMPAPAVYDPGGLTVMIDDFCVIEPELWPQIGTALLQNLKKEAEQQGAIQIVVVCGHHDEAKKNFLQKADLNIASEWYIGKI